MTPRTLLLPGRCDVFTELFCLTPCATYTKFTDLAHNHIMQRCAASTGLDWDALERCAAVGSELGDKLQQGSAARSKADGATYGTKGLPVVTVGSGGGGRAPTLVRTAQKVPLYCGPTPLEFLRAMCGELGAAAPAECRTTTGLCGLIQNASRLPDCRPG